MLIIAETHVAVPEDDGNTARNNNNKKNHSLKVRH